MILPLMVLFNTVMFVEPLILNVFLRLNELLYKYIVVFCQNPKDGIVKSFTLFLGKFSNNFECYSV